MSLGYGWYKSDDVAAAIMAIEGGEWHYKVITQRVIDSGLSKLGANGQTAPQTLGSIMRKSDIFTCPSDRYNEGIYELKNIKCIHNCDIAEIINNLLPKYLEEYNNLLKQTINKNIEYGNMSMMNDFSSDYKEIRKFEKIFHRLMSMS